MFYSTLIHFLILVSHSNTAIGSMMQQIGKTFFCVFGYYGNVCFNFDCPQVSGVFWRVIASKSSGRKKKCKKIVILETKFLVYEIDLKNRCHVVFVI